MSSFLVLKRTKNFLRPKIKKEAKCPSFKVIFRKNEIKLFWADVKRNLSCSKLMQKGRRFIDLNGETFASI